MVYCPLTTRQKLLYSGKYWMCWAVNISLETRTDLTDAFHRQHNNCHCHQHLIHWGFHLDVPYDKAPSISPIAWCYLGPLSSDTDLTFWVW
jgi:hypothetical protein